MLCNDFDIYGCDCKIGIVFLIGPARNWTAGLFLNRNRRYLVQLELTYWFYQYGFFLNNEPVVQIRIICSFCLKIEKIGFEPKQESTLMLTSMWYDCALLVKFYHLLAKLFYASFILIEISIGLYFVVIHTTKFGNFHHFSVIKLNFSHINLNTSDPLQPNIRQL